MMPSLPSIYIFSTSVSSFTMMELFLLLFLIASLYSLEYIFSYICKLVSKSTVPTQFSTIFPTSSSNSWLFSLFLIFFYNPNRCSTFSIVSDLFSSLSSYFWSCNVKLDYYDSSISWASGTERVIFYRYMLCSLDREFVGCVGL